MRRWLLWFLLAPHTFLVAGLWSDAGLPTVDASVLMCLFLSFFARRSSVPWLLLGAAIGRALVDEASLPVQILVLGVPTAVLTPMRGFFFGRRWAWQAVAAAVTAVAVPRLAGWCGRLFGEPSASATLDGTAVAWAALLVPPLLWLARRLPPFTAFEDEA